MTKTQILDVVITWLHNALADSQRENFWTAAKSAIGADVYGIDTTVAGWETAHAAAYPTIWIYSCLVAGRVFTEDAEGQAAANAVYQDEVGRLSTSPNVRQVTGQLRRPYGA